jgi:hypothetical protein
MTARCLTLLVSCSFVLSACADDDLNAAPAADVTSCPAGAVMIQGQCLATGTITGRICDHDTGDWLEGATASITLADGSAMSGVTTADGRFFIDGVPAGSYYIHVEGPGYVNDFAAFVAPGASVNVGATSCGAAGNLKGRVCDENTGLWVGGATVALDDPDGTSTVTDAFGRYQFASLVPGSYTLTITAPGYSGTRSGTVYDGVVTDLGPAACTGGDGAVQGRICGGDGYWLSGARVFIDLGGGSVVETTSNVDGNYTLTGVPSGTHIVQVTRGAVSTSFSVTVESGDTTVLPESICIPPTARLAVVTGQYDAIEVVLAELGFPTRHTYNSTSPTTANPDGNVDIIKGSDSFWIDEFMNDPTWLNSYDVLFLNCGLDDWDLYVGGSNASTALNNLQDFVAAGGSVYASDWASEVLREAFPGRLNFHGNDDTFGAARIGNSNTSQSASVLDTGLAAALGTSTVTINLDLPSWVVLDTQTSQPSDLRVLVRGNISYSGGFFGGSSTLNNSPLIVQFTMGTGRVLFTSAHNEGQNTPDLEEILRYIVFEL